jgi:hypothetical protein
MLRLISYAWFLHPYLPNSFTLAQELTLINMLCFEGLQNETKMGMLWSMSGRLTELADALRAEMYFPIPLCRFGM